MYTDKDKRHIKLFVRKGGLKTRFSCFIFFINHKQFMAEVFEPVIRIDTGDSERSVKELRKEISTLRDHILNLEKGTDEYNDAVKRLQQDQRDLDEVMALTKRTATALEGSYDALTQQMSLLKKEWRATNDAARRSELAEEISKINTELKEMDAEIGNFQRNVGNYVSHWEGMTDATRDFGAEMRNAMEAVEPTKMKFESVANIAGGLASGFAAVQGAAALLGKENEKLEETFIKLQAAMALAQGIGGLSGLVEGLAKAKVAFAGIKGVLAGGAGVIALFAAVVAGAIALVGNMDDLFRKTDKAAEAQRNFNEEISKMAANKVGDTVVRLKELATTYKNIGDNAEEKKKFVAEFAEELDNMGISMNGVNEADRIFITNTDDYITAVMNRAKADAIREKATEDYKKALEKQAELEKALEVAKADRDAGTPQKSFWQNLAQATVMAGTAEGVPFDQANDLVNDWDKEIADNAVNAAQTALDNAVEAADAALEEAFKKAGQFDDLASKYLKKKTPTPKPTTTELPTLDDIEIDDVEFSVPMTEEQIQAEGEIYKKKKAAFLAIEKTYADDSVKIEERKLERLKELHQEAVDVGDYESQLLLMADIADQEVALTEAKNQAIIESEEKRKKKQLETINQVQTAISAAANVTQAILEITQAAAEKDGEITEKEAKKIKGMQIAVATMNMLAGITAAISGCFTTKTGPWDIALAAVQAATIAATGTANIMKIRNTDLTGQVTSGAMGAVTPNSNVYGTDLPISYVRNVTTASETDALNQDTKVYVLESDITKAVNKQKVRVEESSF